VEVCPVNCIIVNSELVETKPQLQAKYVALMQAKDETPVA
jgi:hypothetical protein